MSYQQSQALQRIMKIYNFSNFQPGLLLEDLLARFVSSSCIQLFHLYIPNMKDVLCYGCYHLGKTAY